MIETNARAPALEGTRPQSTWLAGLQKQHTMPLLPRKRRCCLLVAITLIFVPSAVADTYCASFVSSRTSARPSTKLHSAVESSHHDRRSIITNFAASAAMVCLPPSPIALAADADRSGKKPFAPVDTLLPATRVKVMIDRAVDIAYQLRKDDINKQRQADLIAELEHLLLKPQNFTRGLEIDVPKSPAKSYLDSYAQKRDQLHLLEKPGAMLVQNGEIRAWKRLKRQETSREEADEARAAMNYYTSNLNFNPDRFVLTGSKEERSKLIREDRVPDVKNVIASDMGIRYLLRNEVLTALDDARAEMEFQLKQDILFDGSELLGILVKAQSSCSKWFDLIDEVDVIAALEIVRRENM